EEAKIDMGNGQEMDISSQTGGPSTTTYTNLGEVTDIKSDQSDPNMYRMAHLQSLPFSAKAVNVGDPWTFDYKKDDKGSVDAKGTYKVEARETINGHDTLKIHEILKESITDSPASSDMMVWIDVKTGDLVKVTGTWTNAPLPGIGPMNLKVSMTLI